MANFTPHIQRTVGLNSEAEAAMLKYKSKPILKRFMKGTQVTKF